MKDYKAILEPESTYHIYNRANGNEQIFLSRPNYFFFLEGYRKYIHPHVSTYCYCLMPNHFHFLVRIKPAKDLTGFQNLSGLPKEPSRFLSNQFSKFFNSYTKAFNKQQSRKGSLFIRPFKRRKVETETYLQRLVIYIHMNPVLAGLGTTPGEWEFSSYNALISTKPSLLDRRELIELFDDKENFIYMHQNEDLSGYQNLTGL